ncbi:MAG: NlpC/P60 family protein [Sphingobium sp.]
MNADHDMTGKRAAQRVRFRLDGRSVTLDRRLNAVRGDLADVNLAGILFAPHYAQAQAMHCVAPAAFLREKANASAPAVSQLLFGEDFHVLDVTGDWAWGFCDHDDYVGYIERKALTHGIATPTHRVTARAAPIFASPDIKTPVIGALSAGAKVAGNIDDNFLITEHGAIHVRHVRSLVDDKPDWVAAAERQIGQPYIWGGRGAGGIDCSGLVQLALGQAGVRVPRDTDLQRDAIGSPIAAEDELQRGDLVFFPGHVGIMMDATNMLHANAFWMSTMIEPLADVIARLRPDHEQPVLARRRIQL